jgi:hypothetical protein
VNDSLREILVTDVPPAFVLRLIQDAAWVYKEAHARVLNDSLLGDAERAYLEPHHRRALFERKLMEAALDSGLQATTERVSSGAAQYNLIRAGRLLLTCSRTVGRNVVPRACMFRGQYAGINEHIDQLQLFPVSSNPGESSLYCIVSHGPSAEKPGELGYCCFAFPMQEGGKWAQEPVDLTDVRDYQKARYQKIDDDRAEIQNVEPKLKPKYGEGSASEESA